MERFRNLLGGGGIGMGGPAHGSVSLLFAIAARCARAVLLPG